MLPRQHGRTRRPMLGRRGDGPADALNPRRRSEVPRKCMRMPGAGAEHVRVERYKAKHWAVYDGRGLVAVTVYRRGARTVADRLNKWPEGRRAKCRLCS